jgi:hypothetical protein
MFQGVYHTQHSGVASGAKFVEQNFNLLQFIGVFLIISFGICLALNAPLTHHDRFRSSIIPARP